MSARPKNADLRSITDRQVVGATYYKNGYAEVMRSGVGGMGIEIGQKQQITEMTAKSRNKLLWTACTTSVVFNSMITLTYGTEFPLEGLAVKSHLSAIIKRLKRWGVKEYIWFLEFQKRTAPHFHVLVDYAPARRDGRLEWLGVSWAKVIGAGPELYSSLLDRKVRSHKDAVERSNTYAKSWEGVKTGDGAIRYLAKYALKTSQKTVPSSYRNVGRFWGVSRGVRENKVESLEMPLNGPELRVWLLSLGHTTKDWDVIPKYLYGMR